jgi:hypothetical protein
MDITHGSRQRETYAVLLTAAAGSSVLPWLLLVQHYVQV